MPSALPAGTPKARSGVDGDRRREEEPSAIGSRLLLLAGVRRAGLGRNHHLGRANRRRRSLGHRPSRGAERFRVARRQVCRDKRPARQFPVPGHLSSRDLHRAGEDCGPDARRRRRQLRSERAEGGARSGRPSRAAGSGRTRERRRTRAGGAKGRSRTSWSARSARAFGASRRAGTTRTSRTGRGSRSDQSAGAVRAGPFRHHLSGAVASHAFGAPTATVSERLKESGSRTAACAGLGRWRRTPLEGRARR